MRRQNKQNITKVQLQAWDGMILPAMSSALTPFDSRPRNLCAMDANLVSKGSSETCPMLIFLPIQVVVI